jgi:hypothetical protein
MIGEYIGRIFAEVKRRPLYVIAEEIGPGPRLAHPAHEAHPATMDGLPG